MMILVRECDRWTSKLLWPIDRWCNLSGRIILQARPVSPFCLCLSVSFVPLFLSLFLSPFCNMWCISFKCKAANCMLKLPKHKIGRTSLAFLGGIDKKEHSTADCLTRHLWGVGVPVYSRGSRRRAMHRIYATHENRDIPGSGQSHQYYNGLLYFCCHWNLCLNVVLTCCFFFLSVCFRCFCLFCTCIWLSQWSQEINQ